MKYTAFVFFVVHASTQFANAASLSVEETIGANGTIYALTLRADEQFNVFGVNITPLGSEKFLNSAPGGLADYKTTEKTFFNVYLEFDPGFGGGSLFAAGKIVSDTRMSVDYGRLGVYIDGSRGIYLGNIVLPAGGSANVDIVFLDTGIEVARISEIVPVPEPATMVLTGISLMGIMLLRPTR